MKTTKLDYINIFFAVILGLLLILNLAVRFQNKEYDKIFWDAEIYSSIENASSETQNSIKIIDAVFYNNFNQSTKTLDYDSEKETNGMTSAKSKKHILFRTGGDKELLPDSLNLKYFSIEERKFYLLTTNLPYDNIKNLVKEYPEEKPILLLEIQPKGKVILKISVNEKEDEKSHIIQTFTAKETTGNLDMLVYAQSLEGKYNDYEGIDNITDFSNLLQNKYKWSFKVEIEDNTILKEISVRSYAHERIEMPENIGITEYRNIPKEFYIKWGNQQEYGIQYYFNAIEILNAFQILNKTDSKVSIIITFKLYKGKYPQCEISKNGKIIPLKDLYPEKPTKYAR